MGCVYPACPLRTPFDYCECHASLVIARLQAEVAKLKTVPSTQEPAIGATLARRLIRLADRLKVVASLRPAVCQPVRWSPRKPQQVSAAIRPVLAAVSKQLGISQADLCGDDQSPSDVRTRDVAMAAVRQLTGASFPELGRAFRRQHTSVISAVRRADQAQVKALVLSISKTDMSAPMSVFPDQTSITYTGHEGKLLSRKAAAAKIANRAARSA